MHYTKLFSTIIHSTIWREPDYIRILWITMLAMKERNDTVQASLPGLADAARITMPQAVEAIERLSSPDEYSRDAENEGRRIEKCPGGWLILNGDKYRKLMNADDIRSYQKQYKKAARAKAKKDLVHVVVNKSTQMSTMSIQSESETEPKPDTKIKIKKDPPTPQGADSVTPIYLVQLFNAIPGFKQTLTLSDTSMKTIQARINEYPSLGWWLKLVETVSKSHFLCGKKTDFSASLLWCCGPKNMGKILAGEYVNREQAFPTTLAERNARNATLAIEAINQRETTKHEGNTDISVIDATSRIIGSGATDG